MVQRQIVRCCPVDMYLVVTVNHAADGSLEVGVVVTFAILDIRREESRQLRRG